MAKNSQCTRTGRNKSNIVNLYYAILITNVNGSKEKITRTKLTIFTKLLRVIIINKIYVIVPNYHQKVQLNQGGTNPKLMSQREELHAQLHNFPPTETILAPTAHIIKPLPNA